MVLSSILKGVLINVNSLSAIVELVMKSKGVDRQIVSFVGVVMLAVIMPGFLKLANNVSRLWVGAEGRLASISIDVTRPLGTLPRVWEGLAQGGENLQGFMREAATDAAKLKPKYIRIDHIYDEFGVVSRNGERLEFDFSKLDKTVNQMVEIGAKPFFSLSYMPLAISSGDILSEPRNWNDWSEVVERTINHYSGELGIENVYYEVWNEPDLFGRWKMGGKKDYKNLYYFAARGAEKTKNVKPFKFGGPAITGLYKNWIDNFFPYVLKNRLRMDFFSWHRYDLNSDQYGKDIASVDKWIESQPYFSGVEKIISEMGPKSDAGGENDTMAGAAHLISINREILTGVRYGFNFAVTGRWGILGKPRYQALEFLSRLGPLRMPLTGEGSFVKAIAAKNGNKIQIVVSNYDSKGIHTEVVPISLLGLTNQKFLMTTQLLGQEPRTIRMATSEAIMQVNIPMSSNSVIWIEFVPQE
jgi:hypothetical protein